MFAGVYVDYSLGGAIREFINYLVYLIMDATRLATVLTGSIIIISMGMILTLPISSAVSAIMFG